MIKIISVGLALALLTLAACAQDTEKGVAAAKRGNNAPAPASTGAASKTCPFHNLPRGRENMSSQEMVSLFTASMLYHAKRYSESFNEFMALAEDGHIIAYWRLGTMYAEGLGIERDEAEGIKWLKKAITAPDQARASVYSAFLLASYYLDDKFRLRDLSEGVSWLRKSADQGLSSAQQMLGTLYVRGRGVPKDNSLAIMWLNRSVECSSEEDREKYILARDKMLAHIKALSD